MADQIFPINPANEKEIFVKDSTTALGFGTSDVNGNELELSVLEKEDKIDRAQFENTILPEAIHILEKCSVGGQLASSRTHLAIGYVQSGKTVSMATLCCLARDNGYNIVVILAGSTNNLVEQTTDRISNYLDLAGPDGSWKCIDTRRKDGAKLSQSMQQVDSSLTQLRNSGRTLVVITMKHHAHLGQLAQIFESRKVALGGLKEGGADVLFIDDEADELSLNSKVNQADVSRTNDELMRMRCSVPNFSYVQYTATPQGPLLIRVNDELSPEHVTLLTPGDGYVGGLTFFGQDSGRYIRTAVDSEDRPEELFQAFCSYMLASSQLFLTHKLKKEPGKKKRPCVSFMVHPAFRKADHDVWFGWISEMKDWLGTMLGSIELDDPAFDSMLQPFHAAYKDLCDHTDRDMLPLSELVLGMKKMLIDLQIWKVNSEGSNVDWSQGQFHILVGGNKLNRGFTVEGLITTYLTRGGRSPADTVEQRARFFGYKKKVLDLCRLYLTPDGVDHFRDYVVHEEKYRDILKPFEEESLRDWKREFWLSPAMKPCRDTILGDPVMRGIAGGKWWSQDQHFHLSQSDHDQNTALCTSMVEKVKAEGTKDVGHLVWESDDPTWVLESLLTSYITAIGPEDMKFRLLLTEISNRVHSRSQPIERVEIRLMREFKDTKRSPRNKNAKGKINPFGRGGDEKADSKQYSKDKNTMTLVLWNMKSSIDDFKTSKDGPALAIYLPNKASSAHVIRQGNQ